jgi:hypothetical protein
VSHKLGSLCASLAVAASLVAIPAPALAGTADPNPIGPRESFIGLVNGQARSATIKMACFGPTRPGRTGHPLAGQTVAAQQVFTQADPLIGNTGDLGRAIKVVLTHSSTGDRPLLREYGAAAIPTSVTLPCDGTGSVWFVPEPDSDTSQNAAVQVTYVSQP